MSSSCCPRLGETVKKFEKPKRAVNRVFIHCSAASRESIDASEINRWHLDRGWSCIGYHYFITTTGVTQYGRDLERTPAAQSGNNTSTIAICLNGLEKSDFNENQFLELIDLCEQIKKAYDGDITFHGHREVAAKECPVFDYKAVLNLNEKGKMV